VLPGRECAAVRCFRVPEFAWRDAYPNLDKPFMNLSQRQSFVDTLPQAWTAPTWRR
jgi:hypothetical protein